MPYLGNEPFTQYSETKTQVLTGNGTVGPYTLDYEVGSVGDVEVFVNNVRQQGGSSYAYTVSGNQLTMTGAVAASDDFYVVFQGNATPSGQIPEKQSDGSYSFNSDLTLGGNLDMSDNDKILLGTSDDLEIYHSGTASHIKETGTGNLKLEGSNIELNNGAGTKTYILATDGGAVQLRHDDATKLETKSTGVDVTGQIDVNSAGRIDSSGRVKGAHGTVGAPSFSFLNDPDNGMFRPTTNTLGFATTGAERFRIESGGNLNFNVEGSNNFRSGIDLRQGSAKMWANWNGSSTVADSYNLTSITDSGTGNYNLNINNDMNSANYSAGGLTQIDALVAYRVSYGADGLISIKRGYSGAMATGSLRVGTGSGNTTLVDNTEACVQTYGDLA